MQALALPSSLLQENADYLRAQYQHSQAQWMGGLTV